MPRKITLQILNFDFDRCVKTLTTNIGGGSLCDTAFEIQERVSKQLFRSDWKKMWSWVHCCDLSITGDENLAAKYIVGLRLAACDPAAASHELYVEAVPYVLKGYNGLRRTSAGYTEIEKMRAALAASADVGDGRGEVIWRAGKTS